MKPKQFLLASALIAGTYLANAQNNEDNTAHLIKTTRPFYEIMIDFDGKTDSEGYKHNDFIRVKKNKKGNYDLSITTLNNEEKTPRTYLVTINKNDRSELSDIDNDGDLDLERKAWNKNSNTYEKYFLENVNNKFKSEVYQGLITEKEYWKIKK